MTPTATMQAGQFGRPILSKDGRTMTVRIPITLRHQGGQKRVVNAARGYTPQGLHRHELRHRGEAPSNS